jgi:hypothetical protein
MRLLIAICLTMDNCVIFLPNYVNIYKNSYVNLFGK